MKQYTAIYSTKTLKNIQYAFQAVDGNMAKKFCHQKFNTTDIIIRDEETGEEFPLIDEWLSDTAYISRCMQSGEYLLYIKHTYPGSKVKEFAPIIDLTKERMDDSTHKMGSWYVAFPPAELEGAKYAFLDFCSNRGGIDFEEI